MQLPQKLLYKQAADSKLGNERSDWMMMQRRVPQCSLVGPLIFNIFKNNLFMTVDDRCTIYNYADDNTISNDDKELKQAIHAIESSTETATNWFKANDMIANLQNSKPWTMVMHRRHCL